MYTPILFALCYYIYLHTVDVLKQLLGIKSWQGVFSPKDSLNHFFKIPNLMSLMGAFLAAFTLRVYCVI